MHRFSQPLNIWEGAVNISFSVSAVFSVLTYCALLLIYHSLQGAAAGCTLLIFVVLLSTIDPRSSQPRHQAARNWLGH